MKKQIRQKLDIKFYDNKRLIYSTSTNKGLLEKEEYNYSNLFFSLIHCV